MHAHGVDGQVEVVNEEREVVEEDCAAEDDVDGVHSGHPHTSDIALKMLVAYRYSNLMHYYIFLKHFFMNTAEKRICTYNLFLVLLEFLAPLECGSRSL